MGNAHLTVAGGTGRIDVDPAAFEGLDMDEINAGASELRKIRARFGKTVMYRVASGLSLREALKLGSSFRPTASS
jgi:hypothetical protein